MPKYKLTYNNSVHVFDSDAFLLDGRKLHGQEYAILNKLVEKKGAYIRKDELADELWGKNRIGEEYNLKPRISQLRSKFGNDRKIIKCDKYKFVDQAGYHLDCEIYKIDDSKASIFTPYMNASISDVDKETEYRIRKIDYSNFETKYLKDNTSFKIAISSAGGIGKTTFARILYNRLQNNYSSVGWIDYSKSLDESILSSTDKWQNESRDIRLEKIDEFFSSNERILLIIDNVIDNPTENQYPLNEEGGYFNFDKLTSYNNLDLIITTRFDRFPGYTVHHLEELDDVACFELFVYYFDSLDSIEDYNYVDYDLISKIVTIAHNNSLLIELFARTAKYRYYDSLNDLYEYIKADRYQEASVVEKVRSLYKIDTLSQQQQQILWEFAILPNISLNGKDLESILFIKPNDKSFRYLVDRGWISVKGKDGCSMHDIIKESILSRSSPNLNKQLQQEDYLNYSYCYDNNTSGFAPDFCYSDLRVLDKTNDIIDNLFLVEGLSFIEIKKMVDLLVAMTNHIKLNVLETGYYFALSGYYTYHKLGNKFLAEHYFRKSLTCIHNSTSMSLPDYRTVFCVNGIVLSFDNLYTITSYELSYALSSMGYDRLKEAYEIMNSTLNNFLLRDKSSSSRDNTIQSSYIKLLYGIEIDDSKYQGLYIDQLIANEFDKICEQYLNQRYDLKTVFSYSLLARILDHAAYIISISLPDKFSQGEKTLKTALRIREIIHGFHSLRKMDVNQYQSFIKPYLEYFDYIYNLILLPDNLEQFKRNCATLKNYYQKHMDNRLMGSEYPAFLKRANTSGDFELSKLDIEVITFGFFSESNYVKSLQDLATTEDNLGYLYIQMNRCSDAEPLLLSALNHRDELEKCEPKKHLSELSWTYNNVGELYLRLYETDKTENYLDEAIRNYRKAVDLRLELNEIFKDRYLDNLAWSYMGLWRCYLNKDDVTEAEYYREKALKLYENLNVNNQYDYDIKILNSKEPLSEPLNWVGNQSHFKPIKSKKARR